jgi:hypothetical protein
MSQLTLVCGVGATHCFIGSLPALVAKLDEIASRPGANDKSRVSALLANAAEEQTLTSARDIAYSSAVAERVSGSLRNSVRNAEVICRAMWSDACAGSLSVTDWSVLGCGDATPGPPVFDAVVVWGEAVVDTP